MYVISNALLYLAGPVFFGLAIFWFTLVFFALFPEAGRAAQHALASVEQVLASWGARDDKRSPW